MSQNGVQRPEICYSGRGDFKNDPAQTAVPDEGPIPVGMYGIGPGYDHPELGPIVMNLTPKPGCNTFGRDLFRLHGDSAAHPGDASHGCIVAPHSLRAAINATQDRILQVTP